MIEEELWSFGSKPGPKKRPRGLLDDVQREPNVQSSKQVASHQDSHVSDGDKQSDQSYVTYVTAFALNPFESVGPRFPVRVPSHLSALCTD